MRTFIPHFYRILVTEETGRPNMIHISHRKTVTKVNVRGIVGIIMKRFSRKIHSNINYSNGFLILI